jgi:hypothetical protein
MYLRCKYRAQLAALTEPAQPWTDRERRIKSVLANWRQGDPHAAEALEEIEELFADAPPPDPRECCDPAAPVVPCLQCGVDVHTCERSEGPDYRCPVHKDGVEDDSAGGWFCSKSCYYEYAIGKRDAALEKAEDVLEAWFSDGCECQLCIDAKDALAAIKAAREGR